MTDQQEHLEDGPESAAASAPVRTALPAVTVPVRRQAWNGDATMTLPADAASHWDERAWNRC
ncbi:hypothetical protein [Streptomyces stelliscabiei]|uniref:hypothetical protein n=1 Tax=Streptomyces stelliscabiei TaxID=146820 RepID=UPI0029AA21CE|nr:hypothetical protein [Streptomyces stelliscabiei]MDX2639922.1 hypothetical protein [Streptomyces stelliscabiei]MDX2662836.1 hypothetical protein [Streptomyces stelliscabiei]MDX2714502.1 hypothetical protein [Streptomyces stelliscabiei]MDX2792239.1 hypothetical protein [Streptomyces stelliscabiei]